MVLEGKSSQEHQVIAGVLRGSILGHTLSVLEMNDLPDVTCSIAIYVDDTAIYSK